MSQTRGYWPSSWHGPRPPQLTSAGLQHFQWRSVPLALALAADRRDFGVKWQGPPTGKAVPLEPRMNEAAQRWKALAAKHRLAEPDVNQLVSWWHTDGDLGRTVECVNDMTESRSPWLLRVPVHTRFFF